MSTQIVEELEDRFGDQMEGILDMVKGSLRERLPTANGASGQSESTEGMQVVYSEYQEDYQEDNQWDYNANEMVFDDTGEGVGIEGDLDVEDD